MWFSGLRGPVAVRLDNSDLNLCFEFALALMTIDKQKLIETTTLSIVVFTTVLMGGATEFIVHALGLKKEELPEGSKYSRFLVD